ncbi:hypothetical protein [Rhodanobacter terrae]|uniref:Uncharacterized protein n=1 Tax=Rhodanobacter terrae TaxID=418647 RepID=A0ABW0T1H4_9GAMM
MQKVNLKPAIRPEGWVAPMVSESVEATSINKFHTKSGHGFAAEDANILDDRLHFRKVENVGTSNTLDGPDRVVNGVKIQTKYCQTAKDTVDAAFKDRKYRYGEQLLEVPSDQYNDCIKIMQEKIRLGQVEGVTDPTEAERLVAKGSVTYKQARNIAKAGTVDGLVYDFKSHSVSATGSFGIAFTLDFAFRVWNGEPTKEAMKESVLTGLASGAITLGVGMVTSQVLRTRAAAIGRVWARDAVRLIYKTQYGKVVINKVAEVSLGKAVGGGAAINHVAKLARSNTITTVATAVIVTAPDMYRATFDGTVSWPQAGKNFSTTVAGSAGGIAGGYSGAALGAAIGTAVAPGPGTAIGAGIGSVLGMFTGGSLGSNGIKKVLDLFVEDDAVAIQRLLDAEMREFVFDYLLTEAEIGEFTVFVGKTIDAKFLRTIYGSTSRGALVTGTFVPKLEEIVAKRERIVVRDVEVEEAIATIMENVLVEASKVPDLTA